MWPKAGDERRGTLGWLLVWGAASLEGHEPGSQCDSGLPAGEGAGRTKRGLAFTYQGRLAWREGSMLRSKLGLWGRDPRGAGWRPVLCVEKGGRW